MFTWPFVTCKESMHRIQSQQIGYRLAIMCRVASWNALYMATLSMFCRCWTGGYENGAEGIMVSGMGMEGLLRFSDSGTMVMWPVASDRCRMHGILVCRVNQVVKDTTAGRPERYAHGYCNPSGGRHVLLCYSRIMVCYSYGLPL